MPINDLEWHVVCQNCGNMIHSFICTDANHTIQQGTIQFLTAKHAQNNPRCVIYK